jgi:alanyl-tRNA synthetase
VTEKLYWNDPFALDFDATLLSLTSHRGATSLVLDRTRFYPEGGGQLGDRGTLCVAGREIAVRDVQIDDDGTVHHLVEGSFDELVLDRPLEVTGRVERDRRRDFMAQHSAQHMLSRALIEVARAETVSCRLGEVNATIDTSLASLNDAALAKAEDMVNDLILDDVPVRTHFPTPEELAAMPLRRAPKVSTGIRIVEVEGFDFTPCGGTHVTRTGQIGPLRIAGTERYKGGTRVTFLAGRRALADARGKDALVADLAKTFTCGAAEIPAAIRKLRADLEAKTAAFAAARGELVQLLADKILTEHPAEPAGTRIFVAREEADLPTLRTLAGALARRPDVIAFVASRDPSGDLLLVVERGSAAAFDCGAWFKATTSRVGGRGGGRPDRAEGRLPAGIDLATVVTA